MTEEQLKDVNKSLNFLGIENVQNIIAITKDATNGDVIKGIFKNAVKSNYIESSLDMKDYVTIYLGNYEMRVSYDWWSTPYKAESED